MWERVKFAIMAYNVVINFWPQRRRVLDDDESGQRIEGLHDDNLRDLLILATDIDSTLAAFLIIFPLIYRFMTDDEIHCVLRLTRHLLTTHRFELPRRVPPHVTRRLVEFVLWCVRIIFESAGLDIVEFYPEQAQLQWITLGEGLEYPTQDGMREMVQALGTMSLNAHNSRMQSRRHFVLAVIMGRHPRLGRDSRLSHMDPEIVFRIVLTFLEIPLEMPVRLPWQD